MSGRVSLLVLAVPLALAQAQQAPTIRLEKAAVVHTAEWTDVVAVRELRDGRLIVLDARDQAVKLVDLTAGTATMIGRKGSGPGEYVLPSRLFAIRGDSVILVDDASTGRPMLILPDGRIRDYPAASPATPFISSTSVADQHGRIYRTGAGRTNLGPDGAGGPAIERFDPRSGRIDTIAFVSRRDSLCAFSAPPPRDAPPPQTWSRAAINRAPKPYLALEQWAVAPDGRIGIACPTPYRVLFIDSAGRRTDGPVIAFDAGRVTERDKEAWREARRAPVAVMRSNAAGRTTTSYEPPRMFGEPDGWPAAFPAFVPGRGLDGAAEFAPDGMLWIRRAVSVGDPSLYDIVGPDGRLRVRVTFPPRSQVVGFGARGIYVITLDEDDIQRLGRFTFPAMGNR